MDVYSTKELRAKIASHEYGAELCLQHAMANIEALEMELEALRKYADALDDIWMCANSGYSLPDLKAKIAMYVEGDSSLTKGF